MHATLIGTRPTLDDLVSPAEQERWAAGDYDLADGGRSEVPGQRRALRGRYDSFVRYLTAGDAVAILNTYVVDVIPKPRATECEWWSLTCLPTVGRKHDQRRLATVSVFAMETLYLRHHDDEHGVGLTGVLNVSRAALAATAGPMEELVSPSGLWSVHPTTYAAADGDAVAVAFDGVDGWDAVVDELPGIDLAARRLVLALLAKGRTPYADQHCYDLADHAIRAIPEADIDLAG